VRQVPQRRGRPVTLTPEAIAQAVLRVGFLRLTFAAVAEDLGVGQATLYRHAPNRDELVRHAMEYVADHTAWPPLEGHWRDVLEAYAITAWRLLAEHPGMATEASRGIVPVAMMRLADELGAMLMRHGFTAPDAVLACDTVLDLVVDHRRGVEHLDHAAGSPEGSADLGREHLHDLWSTSGDPTRGTPTQSGPDEREQVHQAMLEAIKADPLDWFTGKLDLVLGGITHQLAPPQAENH
jgi:AcrR family transcriptional regulator